MIGADLLALDVDTLRFLVVAGVLVGGLVYARFGLVAGGTLTGGYLAILAIRGDWNAIAVVIGVAAIVHYLVRVMLTRYVALPKAWVFSAFVLASSLVTAILRVTADHVGALELPGELEIYFSVAAYVTPGLIAYDFAHQGFRPTLIGFGLVFIGTLVMVVPVLAVANWWRPESTTIFEPVVGQIPDGWFWLAALASTSMSIALRLSAGIRSAGFLGAVFLVEFVTIEAFVTVIVSALVAKLITDLIRRFVIVTPRQRFEISLVIGAMVAWTGLYWGTRLGWAPAAEANIYAIEPLVVVGLLTSDLGRSQVRAWKVIVGLVGTSAYVWLVVESATSDHPALWAAAAALSISAPVLAAWPAIRKLRESWTNAVRIGFEAADEFASSRPSKS